MDIFCQRHWCSKVSPNTNNEFAADYQQTVHKLSSGLGIINIHNIQYRDSKALPPIECCILFSLLGDHMTACVRQLCTTSVRGHPQLYVPLLYTLFTVHISLCLYICLLLFGYDLTLSCSQYTLFISLLLEPPCFTSFCYFTQSLQTCLHSLESVSSQFAGCPDNRRDLLLGVASIIVPQDSQGVGNDAKDNSKQHIAIQRMIPSKAQRGVVVGRSLEEGNKSKTKFISKVRISYPTPFTFILEV